MRNISLIVVNLVVGCPVCPVLICMIATTILVAIFRDRGCKRDQIIAVQCVVTVSRVHIVVIQMIFRIL
jgi:hypothetical protein